MYNIQKEKKKVPRVFSACPRQIVLCEMVAMKSRYGANNLYICYSKDVKTLQNWRID